VATSKITGEEDRYSHTDLWDFDANVAGVKAAVDALRPALSERDADLMSDVDDAFASVQSLLATHKSGDGYVLYADLGDAQVKALADAVSGLAEPISKVAAAISGPVPRATQ
jgi:iron uptake system component EfeO